MVDAVGAVAAVLAMVAGIPYLVAAIRGRVRPHVCSWVLWGMTTAVIWAGMVAGGAGPGAWAMAAAAALTLATAGVAAVQSLRGLADARVDRRDLALLAAGVAALPLWAVAGDPTLAIVVLTMIDAVALVPTWRRAWHQPWREGAFLFSVLAARNAVILAALDRWSVATVIFPLVLGVGCLAIAVMVVVRRRRVPRPPDTQVQPTPSGT